MPLLNVQYILINVIHVVNIVFQNVKKNVKVHCSFMSAGRRYNVAITGSCRPDNASVK